MSTRETTVFIIMDAGRHDYVNEESMPFLHGLAEKNRSGTFDSPPGFAQRTILFTGQYPDTSGNFSAFVYDPENSPFKWVKKTGPLAGMVKPRKVFYPARKAIQMVTRQLGEAFHGDPAWIPPQYLPSFRPCEDMQPVYEPGALGQTSIFDLCREHGKSFRYLAHPVSGDDDKIHDMLVRDLRGSEDYDLYVAQFSVTDQQGHVHGPHSRAMRQGFLRELDDKFASIHAALEANYDRWNLIICGDHGMGPVTSQFDILDSLKKVDAEPVEDYIVFVNSTLAVFWYETEKGRRAVEEHIKDLPGTRVLTDDDRRRLRIPTERRWGDRMLAADPGVLFWPDYFHVEDSRILGMHGYIDKSEESYGIALHATDKESATPDHLGHRGLVDVFPTLCDLLGVPVPESNEGISMLKPRAQPPEVDAGVPITAR